VTQEITSQEMLDHLYNEQVKRFYSDGNWRRKFRKRLWQHHRSLFYFLRHLPAFWSAKNQFEPGR
jgi:anaerobic magnesium-protoporphyrin IX monomethyl ester cyclase